MICYSIRFPNHFRRFRVNGRCKRNQKVTDTRDNVSVQTGSERLGLAMAQGAAAMERHRRQERPKPSKALRDGLRLWMFEEVCAWIVPCDGLPSP